MENKQYFIFTRAMKEPIPVTEEMFKEYFRDVDLYRRKQHRHGRCVCPKTKTLSCDMDCWTCPYSRGGDTCSLDAETENNGGVKNRLGDLTDEGLPMEDTICDRDELIRLLDRIDELMPEARTIGKLREEGLTEDEIGEKIGIGRKTYAYRLKRLKEKLAAEFQDFFEKL